MPKQTISISLVFSNAFFLANEANIFVQLSRVLAIYAFKERLNFLWEKILDMIPQTEIQNCTVIHRLMKKWTYLGLFPSVNFLFSNIKTTSFVCFLCENCQIANSLTLSCTHCLLIPHLLIKKEIAIKWQYKISINDNIASFVHSWKPWLDILPLCFPVTVRRNALRRHTVSSSVTLVLTS